MSTFVRFQTSDEAKNYIREALDGFEGDFDIDGIFEDTFVWEDGYSRRDQCFYADAAGFYCYLDPDQFWRQVQRNERH